MTLAQISDFKQYCNTDQQKMIDMMRSSFLSLSPSGLTDCVVRTQWTPK